MTTDQLIARLRAADPLGGAEVVIDADDHDLVILGEQTTAIPIGRQGEDDAT